jgi:hypothetical protein
MILLDTNIVLIIHHIPRHRSEVFLSPQRMRDAKLPSVGRVMEYGSPPYRF